MPPVPAAWVSGLIGTQRPAGDPDALRTVRDALIGPVTGLLTLAGKVEELATVAGWQGPAADAFASRMQASAGRMRSASRALGDGQQAFDALANSLQDADEFWGLGRALVQGGVPAAGSFADASEVASSAFHLARQRLDDAAHRLAPLALQARTPPPKPMTYPINPCGIVPEEAAGAFWNRGMMPLNTECLGVVEVTIDVDGIPVETFEAVPIGRGTDESRAKGSARDEPIQSPEEKARIRARIDRQLAVGTLDEKFEANLAKGILANGFPVLKFRAPFVTSEGDIGEVDIESTDVIVEATTSPDGKSSQTNKYEDILVNPKHKQVVVFGPRFTKGAAADLAQKGVVVLRNFNELIDLLYKLRG